MLSCPSINQSINQSVNQSINQSITESISQSINQSTNQSINLYLKHRYRYCTEIGCTFDKYPFYGGNSHNTFPKYFAIAIDLETVFDTFLRHLKSEF